MELNIKKVLQDKGISVAELERISEAKGNKVTRVAIFRLMDKTTSPRLDTLMAIADALNVSLFELFDNYDTQNLHPLYIKDDAGTFREVGYLKKMNV